MTIANTMADFAGQLPTVPFCVMRVDETDK